MVTTHRYLRGGTSALVAALGCATLMVSGPATAVPQFDSAAPVTGEGASFGHYQPKPLYDGIDSRSFYVTMRDGVKIAVRVDRPTLDGKVVDAKMPVIWQAGLSVARSSLTRDPDHPAGYGGMPDLTQYGYVVVQVARRGNGQSFGVMRGYQDRNEAYDSFEIIDWLSKQDWSNGKVGMYGCSNTGDATMQALSTRPPALKAIFAGCFSWHKYDAFRRGGIYAQWGTGPSRTVEQDMANDPVDTDPDKVMLAQAAQEHQHSTVLLDMWAELPYRDSHSDLVGSRFWQEGSAASYAGSIALADVPVYIQGGWFDELRDQGLIAHLNLPNSRVVIGPWTHCGNDDFALLQEMHRFFDYYLKDIDTGLSGDKPIHYFTMNAPEGGAWRSSDTWPVAGVHKETMYFGDGSLISAMPAVWQKQFTADYSVTCDTGFGPVAQPCHIESAGPSFAGSVLVKPVEVTGDVVVDLWVAADGTDANVFAYLEDVAPDGSVTMVTEGRLKASLAKVNEAPWLVLAGTPWHRSYKEDAKPLVPGEPLNLRFAMMSTSYVFQPGHRIRISVTGADHRERIRDPEVPPRITLLGGAGHDSQVILPVVR